MAEGLDTKRDFTISKGFDASQRVTRADFKALKEQGYTHFTGRVFRSNGKVDKDGIQNIIDAQAEGYTTDAYFFPCLNKTAEVQIEAVTDALRGIKIGRIYFDVEGNSWSRWTQGKNREFILECVEKLEKTHKVGIYTNRENWKNIVGLDFNALCYLPLWYAHYDFKANFEDFKNEAYGQFGGWTSPFMKQFDQNVKIKGAHGTMLNIDPNYKSSEYKDPSLHNLGGSNSFSRKRPHDEIGRFDDNDRSLHNLGRSDFSLPIHCPPPKVHCPPPLINCPPPQIHCPTPFLHCPPSQTHCPTTLIDFLLPQTHCPPPQIPFLPSQTHCPPTQTVCPATPLSFSPPQIHSTPTPIQLPPPRTPTQFRLMSFPTPKPDCNIM